MVPKPKLSIAQMGEIRRRMAEPDPPTQAQLAEEYGVGRTTIAAALAGAAAPEDDAPTSPAATVPHASLTPNPRNPRKTFSAESITELAESIAARGLLQPLLVRAAAGGKNEIIAGERRWRAIGELIAANRHGPDVPCIIRDESDAESLALSIIENLQREDISVLEEANAFNELHQMDAQAWSLQNIADAIGKSVRFVQQRVAIATKLHPHFQRALAEDILNVEGARLLCQVSKEDQLKIANQWNLIEDGELQLDCDPIDADDIKWAVDGLERENRREREIQQHREHNMRLDQQERDEQQAAPLKTGGDLFEAPSRPEPPKPEVKTEPVTKAHRYHAHNRKTLALREALRAKPMLAIRATCYSLMLPANDIVCIQGVFNGLPEDRVPVAVAHDKAIAELAAKMPMNGAAIFETKTRLKIWTFLEKLDDAKLMKLFANLVARHIGTRAGHDAQYGDDPVTVAIAHAAGIAGHEEDFGLTLQEDDLAGVRKPALLGIADEAGTPAVNDEMKPAEIAAQITKHSKSYVLPTMRFATSAEIEKAMQFK